MKKRWIFLTIGAVCLFAFWALQSMAYSKEPVVIKHWCPNWPAHIEISRMLHDDLKKLGIEFDIRTATFDEWVGEIVAKHNPYHTVIMSWGGGPERLEPSFFLTEFFHSSRSEPGGRNYGHYINKEYDQIIDEQIMEMDRDKRQRLIRKAQEIIARDNVFFPIFHRDYVQAYNDKRIEGVIPVMGNGIGFPYTPWTFYKAKPKGDITEPKVVNIHDIHTLNPFSTPDVENEGWLRLIYDTFAKRDKDTNLIPWAAESWTVVDDKTVDIVLRDGMKFHDGKPVTVEDVKFTFDYIKKWEFPPLSRAWKSIESVELLGNRGVRFKLYKPYAPFAANILLHAFIAPKHIWEKIPESVGVSHPIDWPNPSPIGSGPYKFVEWKKGEYFHYKANKEHFIGPNFDGFYYIFNPTIEGCMSLLEKGEAEIMGWYLDPQQARRLDALPDLTMIRSPNHGLHEIRPNLSMKPMDDPMFRKAIQHAINRKAMLEIIAEGWGIVCRNTPITPLLEFWNNPDIPVVEYDLDKAKKILAEAGYTLDDKGRLCYP